MAAENPAMKLDPKYDHYDYPTTAPEAKPGHPGHTTEAQQAQIEQLRMMLEADGHTKRLDTLTLLRFLRARKFDVPAAKKMFEDCEKWRSHMTTKTGAETISVDEKGEPINLDKMIGEWDTDGSFKAQVSKRYKQFYHKTDKDGRPVYIEQLGGIDLAALKAEGITEHKMLLNLAVEYEKMADPRLPACSRKAGQLLETCCTVMDFKGVGLSNASSVFGYIQQASEMSNNNYPERLGHMYLINTPWGFSTVFKIVKNFLDPVTASKIHVPGSTSEAKKVLLAQIPAENLPAEFGGSCKCEGGCDMSDAGPWRDPQWTKPAWWQQQQDTIVNKPTETTTEAPTAAPGPVMTEDVAHVPVTSPAAGAPAPGAAAPAPQ